MESDNTKEFSERIIILLPVYNGEHYLREQLDSILAQTCRNILLVCRDDFSSDDSAAIIAEYAQRQPKMFRVMPKAEQNIGASASFSLLMQTIISEGLLDSPADANATSASCNYIALADQDDIWYPEKLQRCLTALQAQERKTPDVPLLVHSDLRVVADEGQVIAESFMHYQGLDASRSNFSARITSNTITGCSVLFNSALLLKASPIPTSAIMHDWWLGLVAAAFGHIVYLPTPLLDYRQHEGNTIGARQYQKPTMDRQFVRRLLDDGNDHMFQAIAVQSQEFLLRHGQQVASGKRLQLRISRILSTPVPILQKCIFQALRRW